MSVQSAPDEFLLKLDKIAGFYVKDGREITIEPFIDSSSPDSMIPDLIFFRT